MFSFLYRCQDFYRTWLYIWVTRQVSFKKQELLILREHLSSPPVFWWVCVAHLSSFFCCPILCLWLSSVLWCDVQYYDFRIKTMFNSSLPPVVCRRCLIYVICICLHIVVSNTYCVVILFCFSLSCVPYFAGFSGLSILISPSVFSNMYLSCVLCTLCCRFLWIVHFDCPFGIL